MNNIELSSETIKLIRSSIRERIRDYASDYKIRKVIKDAIANPSAWSAGIDGETLDDCVQRYYRNINNTFATNIFVDFQNDMLRCYNIFA